MTTLRLVDIRSVSDLVQYATLLLTDSRYFSVLAGFVLLGDAVLTQLIIHFIPYTEIDWETYMYQLELYLKGEKDYALISGPTGPLVYPAGHVYVHAVLRQLTGGGSNIVIAQQIYGLLYLVSLALTCTIYGQAGNVPNWVLLLLPLSKRLHSIYVLRLFNDCWSVVAAQVAILAYGIGFDSVGTVFYSLALSVKMSALLYLPGILVVMFRRRGLLATVLHMVLITHIQFILGYRFLKENPWSYLKYSYEFTRVFLYKWTVNWRFVSEDTFLSPAWAKGLLLGHVLVLIAFGLFKWCQSGGGVWNILSQGLRNITIPPSIARITTDHVVTVLFTSNLIGILFARSLHYQFYSWYAYQLPFIVCRTKYPWTLRITLLAAIEYAWNVYPSTTFSSGVLFIANALLVSGVWFGYPQGVNVPIPVKQKLR
ncbi:Dol-P-Man:Man(5)GlcNAc(2)-PP-Dol alpha-1,3-mannosyltransferase [Abortiporus biennis]